jgi:hypothetical protein
MSTSSNHKFDLLQNLRLRSDITIKTKDKLFGLKLWQRKWKIIVGVYDDPLEANNGLYILEYGKSSNVLWDNDNWRKLEVGEYTQLQTDWNEVDEASPAYLVNKPIIPSLDGYATETWVENKNYLTEFTETDPVFTAWRDLSRLRYTVFAAPNEADGAPSWRRLDYSDIDNTPTIPDAQVNSDWNAVSGVAEILNKPTLLSQFTNDPGFITNVTVPGSTTEVIFNDSDVLGADSGFAYNKTSKILTLQGEAPVLRLRNTKSLDGVDGQSYIQFVSSNNTQVGIFGDFDNISNDIHLRANLGNLRLRTTEMAGTIYLNNSAGLGLRVLPSGNDSTVQLSKGLLLGNSAYLTNGTLRYTGSDFQGRLGDNWVSLTSASPGGSDTHVQFNNDGAFGGDSNFAWDNSNKRLGIATASYERLSLGSGVLRATNTTTDILGLYTSDANPDSLKIAYKGNSNASYRYWLFSSSIASVVVDRKLIIDSVAVPDTNISFRVGGGEIHTSNPTNTNSAYIKGSLFIANGANSISGAGQQSITTLGAVKIGSTSVHSVGSIRWTGSDFQGNINGTSGGWVSLTSGEGGGGVAGVTSFNGRDGVVTPQANDYTWAQINKATSSIADITTRGITLLTANNWKVFYSNGSGQLVDLSLGASGTVLYSNGTASAPTWETVSSGGTTYTAGLGIALNGTEFSVDGGEGLTQSVNGLQLTSIISGDGVNGALRYSGTSQGSGRLFGGTNYTIQDTTRLNYGGSFYAHQLYENNGGNPKRVVTEAPIDANIYARKDGDWVQVTSGGGTSYNFINSVQLIGSNVNLVGDAATPGNSKYYGTNSSGFRGFYDLPTGSGPSYTFADSISEVNGTVKLVGDIAQPGSFMAYGTNQNGTKGWYNNPTAADLTGLTINEVFVGNTHSHYVEFGYLSEEGPSLDINIKNHRYYVKNITTNATITLRTDGLTSYSETVHVFRAVVLELNIDNTDRTPTWQYIQGENFTESIPASSWQNNTPLSILQANTRYILNIIQTSPDSDGLRISYMQMSI